MKLRKDNKKAKYVVKKNTVNEENEKSNIIEEIYKEKIEEDIIPNNVTNKNLVNLVVDKNNNLLKEDDASTDDGIVNLEKKLCNQYEQELEDNIVEEKKEIDEIEFDITTGRIRTEKQKKVLQFVKDNEGVTIPEIEIFLDISRAIVNTLVKNGYLEIIEKKVERNPLINKKIEKLCEKEHYTYIPVYDELLDENKNMALKYTLEGIHLTHLGYLKVTRTLYPYLES